MINFSAQDPFVPSTPTSADDQGVLKPTITQESPLEHSIEEAGAAEELLALASEASLSSPISRESVFTPLQERDTSISNLSERLVVDGTSSDDRKSAISSVDSTGVITASSSSASFQQNSFYSTGAKHVCHNCKVTSTPFWRKAADGHYYCNACGLYLRTHQTQRPTSLSQNRESRRNKQRPEMCANCGAKETPMWRKCGDGLMVCNACGLYWKLHGCHRKAGEAAAVKKRPKSSEGNQRRPEAIVKTNNASSSSVSSSASASAQPRYSLESNLFHHLFKPATTAPVTATKTLSLEDQRKLAFLKHANGRINAPIAPKPQQSTSPVPPILSTIIQTLASSPTEEISEFNGHPLQPLITSIVSEKLSQRQQQQQQQMPLTPYLINNLHLQNFFEDQNAISSTITSNAISNPISNPISNANHNNSPFLPRSATQSPLFLNVNNHGQGGAELENHQSFLNNAVLPRPPSATGFLSRGQSPMTLMNKDLVDFVDFQFWADQGAKE